MMATAERTLVARTAGSANLCPGCGPVSAARSFYCTTHIADLWKQVWAIRPDEPTVSLSYLPHSA
jgi:hypothetical protein